jgi:hypothetical protein
MPANLEERAVSVAGAGCAGAPNAGINKTIAAMQVLAPLLLIRICFFARPHVLSVARVPPNTGRYNDFIIQLSTVLISRNEVPQCVTLAQ